jgi:hypothetical protein
VVDLHRYGKYHVYYYCITAINTKMNTNAKSKDEKDKIESIQEIQEIQEIQVIQEIQEIDNDDHEHLESELDNIVGEIEADCVPEKPKISLKFRSANFVHTWDLNSTNQNCICEKPVTGVSEKDIQNRLVKSDYVVSRCGCAYHSSCIDSYVHRIADNDINMANCPLCHTKYEPIDSTKVPGVFAAA